MRIFLLWIITLSLNNLFAIQEVIIDQYKWKTITGKFGIRSDGTLYKLLDFHEYRYSVELYVSPIQISNKKWKFIYHRSSSILGIQEDGSLWGWGRNDYGQLGDGTTENRLSPVQISNKKWKIIYDGTYHILGVQEDGTLWGWGRNDYGQLGDGTTKDRLSPVQIGNKKWKIIFNNFESTLGIQEDGSLWGWGRNSFGQLGDGTTENRLTPVQIGDKKWSSISIMGLTHIIGIQEDGTLWAWGNNRYGELGDGTTENRLSPVQIGNKKWSSISTMDIMDWFHIIGIQEDGTLWAWGNNRYGELGDGTTENRLSPVQIGNKKWKIIFNNFESTLGIQENGTLWAWGRNGSGQLGDGTTENRLSPVQISNKKWSSISIMGWTHVIGIQEDGTLWGWGDNRYGELGGGTTENRLSPVQIGNKKWKLVASHLVNLGIQEDDTLWAWGPTDIDKSELITIPTLIGFKKCNIDNKSIDVNLLTHLKKGWHLIGSSYEITNFCIFHHIDLIYSLDKNNDKFSYTKRTIDKGDNNITLPAIQAKSGFWIYNATDDNIDINYTKEILPKDKQEHITKAYLERLSKGWHMIGTSYQINSSKALFSQESGIKRVLIFTEGQYKDITDKETTIPPYSGISLFKE